MSQISLTASMRSNLLSLQGTASLMDQTQERLSSGKKVNSAIDNPSSYYTAQSLTNRANDLSGLLDNMGQAISTIKAANEGIEAITSFVEQAKAVATSALDTTDTASRIEYGKQLKSILTQIDQLAKDSGYKGINLLQGDNLTVTFNESRDNKLDISGVNADSASLGFTTASTNFANNEAEALETAQAALDKYIKDTPVAAQTGVVEKLDVTFDGDKHASEELSAGDIYLYNGKYYKAGETIGTTVDISTKATDATEVVKYNDKWYLKTAINGGGQYATYVTAKTAYDTAVAGLAGTIKDAITEATNAIDKLREYASAFGNNYSIVQTREDFTTNLINVLEEGADKLTLADMNEESANMLALQTRQQLAINSLSLASQAAQSVLKLFS